MRKRGGIFYGYWIVAAGCALSAVNGGLYFYGFGAFFKTITEELGTSRAVLSGAFSLARLEGGLVGPLEGWLIDRFGPRKVLYVGIPMMALGFVLRAVAGAVAIDVDISGWLLICTLLVALFLALGKRRHEHNALRGDAALHRSTLGQYNQALLDQMIAMVTASTITSYALYTVAPDTVAKFQTHLLPLTLPFVLYGIFRYLYLLYRRDLGGNPSDLMLADRPLLLSVGLWALATLSIIYGRQLLRWL